MSKYIGYFKTSKKRAAGEITLCNQSQSCTIVTKMTILFRFLLRRGGGWKSRLSRYPSNEKYNSNKKYNSAKKSGSKYKRTKFT